MAVLAQHHKKNLQSENERLQTLLKEQAETIRNQANFINLLHQKLQLSRLARFGRKSEKDLESGQQSLPFDDIEPVENQSELETPSEPSTETITYTRNKQKPGRKSLPKELPFVEYVHDLPEEEKQCPCGCALTHIRDEITEQLDIIPQRVFRAIHIRKQYACKGCEGTMRLSRMPLQPIPQSIAAPGLLAMVIDAKFNRHMPLFRQEAVFKDAGLSLTRGTLSHWLSKSSDLVAPLVKLMTADIVEYDIAYADETSLQVLKEKDRLPTQKSYMWLFSGGPPERRAFVYQYHPTRSQDIPFRFFEDFKGYVHADCYQAYVNLGKTKDIQHVACWAHARRYFADILKINKKPGVAHAVVKRMALLYELEKKLKEQKATPAQVFIARLRKAIPVLKALHAFLLESSHKTLPKSPLGQAIFYTLTHWNSLMAYCYDGRLEIDNNRSERAIKPFVIGRKNWIFHGSEKGAHAGSILYSLVETCKQHKINVFDWFKYVLTHISSAHTLEKLQALLPYNINPNLLENMSSIPPLLIPE